MNQFTHYLVDVLVIMIAIGVWDTARDIYHWYRYKDVESVRCELCSKIRMTYRTKDQKLWACRQCRAVYNKEHGV